MMRVSGVMAADADVVELAAWRSETVPWSVIRSRRMR
jgi:hypothetical protein